MAEGMSPTGRRERDRDAAGRPRNARPRDELGRPLQYGAAGVEGMPDDLALSLQDHPGIILTLHPSRAHGGMSGCHVSFMTGLLL